MRCVRPATLPVLVVAAAILLSGCTPPGESPSSATATPSATPSASGDTTATAAPPADAGGPAVTPAATQPPAPDPGIEGTPFTIDCDALVAPQAVYNFNPNYGRDPSAPIPAGEAVSTAVSTGGTLCGWLNQTSGATFQVAVAELQPPSLDRVRQSAAAGSATDYAGGDAFYALSDGKGTVQAFKGPFWVVATSDAFLSAADARPLVEAALSALP